LKGLVAVRWGVGRTVGGAAVGRGLRAVVVGFRTVAWLIVTRRLSEDTVSKGRFAATFQLGSSGTFLPVEG
jgi:ATP:corrinoid adenosyltransferase